MVDFEYQQFNGAFMAIARSPEMEAELGRVAQSMADAATRDAERHASELRSGHIEKTPYMAATHQLSGTCMGTAYASSDVGVLMEHVHKCLSKQNH